MRRTTVLALLLFATAAGPAATDQLVRRGFLGIATAAQNGKVVVTVVIPRSAAAAAGIHPGDVVASIDAHPVSSAADVVALLHRPAGSTATLGLIRNGTPIQISASLPEAPKEIDPAVDTFYRAVEVDGSLRRVLITAPHGSSGSHPAVFFIGGIGCASVDTASPHDGDMRFAHDLSAHGFVTMRLEKSGVGDSQGAPCPTVDFWKESRSYEVALRAFMNDPLVQSRSVFLYGHSIGTIIAPELASKFRVAGIIAAEAVGRSWFEYELDNTRRQLALAGVRPADVDPVMQSKERCMHWLLIDRDSEAAAIKREGDCASHFPYPVDAGYVQELATLNIMGPWTKLIVPVLAIYGASDFVVERADHEMIVAAVNQAHPGLATFREVPGMDHYLWIAPSQQASFDRAMSGRVGDYDPEFGKVVVAWLCGYTKCT